MQTNRCFYCQSVFSVLRPVEAFVLNMDFFKEIMLHSLTMSISSSQHVQDTREGSIDEFCRLNK